MVLGRVNQGQLQLDAALPEAWEGQTVKIVPCTPDDQLPDLEDRLAALHALGPMEYGPGEREQIERELRFTDEVSRRQMQQLGERDA